MNIINFVIGPAVSGKSTFIKNTFKNCKVVDLWDFQKDLDFFTIENILDSYKKTEEELIRQITASKNKTIILEHTLLRAERRKPYIDAIKKVSEEAIINCYIIKPTLAQFKKNCKNRDIDYEYAKDGFNILEIPTKQEGFNNVYIIKPSYD